ncbi:MAG: tetratricopeptide repeat protein [Saprospiraceae bacterium]|nr:tetratricopeptide repeat protein [Saprospiraceae bacterium]
MQHKKIQLENVVIEYTISSLAKETVKVNGQIVSRKWFKGKSSHIFSLVERGENVAYNLISKLVDHQHILLSLDKNGVTLIEDVQLESMLTGVNDDNLYKAAGQKSLELYDLSESIEHFKKASLIDPNDPEVYFLMACAHSQLENTKQGILNLERALEKGFHGIEKIATHESLAYLRLQPEFKVITNIISNHPGISS